MVLDFLREFGNFFGKNGVGIDCLFEVFEENYDFFFFFDVFWNFNNYITSIFGKGNLYGNIFFFYVRVILCFFFKNGGGFRNYIFWD